MLLYLKEQMFVRKDGSEHVHVVTLCPMQDNVVNLNHKSGLR